MSVAYEMSAWHTGRGSVVFPAFGGHKNERNDLPRSAVLDEGLGTEMRALTEFFRRLVSRGLSPDAGILCVIDDSKGLRAAIRKSFGEGAPV